MSDPRQPAAFRIDPPPREAEAPTRVPRAFAAQDEGVMPAEIDVFDTVDPSALPPLPVPTPRRSVIGAALVAALGVLVSLALGLWIDALIRDLWARHEWLGWLAAGAAALAVLAVAVILAREGLALRRLASVEAMRARAAQASSRDDAQAARRVTAELASLLASKPETAAGRRVLADTQGDIIDGAALLGLAERELLAPLDARAKILVLDAAKRVSLVTTVSPRALFDVAYVLWEGARLVRRLSELYGGRPGTLGFFRLARSALAHLAVTGSIAAGDSLVQQLVGHGLAARLSARLGEGVINGMMTARIGIAAMEAARPLPFAALRRPGVGDFLAALLRLAEREKQAPSRAASARPERFGK
ncbi:MAG TPA: TIGR01620 family protein [Mesorhizobium sp.]|jgi:putative membrane protein|nr:TIGR01620 family protein [Mesorhizobium sp.]